MAETGRTDNGGFAVREAGGPWIEVDEATYEQAQKSRVGRVAGAFGDALRDSAGFAVDMMTPDQFRWTGGMFGGGGPLERRTEPLLGERMMMGNDARQEARSNIDPVASGVGTAGAFLAEMAVPGAPVANRARGAVSAGMRRNVDQVVQRNRSLSAAENTTARTTGEMPFLTVEQADNMSMPLTKGERLLLQAAETQDEAKLARAERGLANEDFLRKTSVMGDTEVGDFMFAGKDKAQWFTQEIADELGRHDLSRLPFDEVVNIRDDTAKVFKEAFDKGNFPVSVAPEGGTDVLNYARKVMDSYDSPSASLKRLVKSLEDAAKEGSDGAFDSARMLEARKAGSDAAEAAFAGGKWDTGTSITSILDTLDEAIEMALPEATRLNVQNARHRWKIKKVLERTSGTMSSTENGIINPVQFAKNWREMTGGVKRHSRKLTDLERAMETIKTLSADRSHAGNTLYRAVGPAAKGVGVLGAGALGAGALFGN